jgi:septation ring formation regulator EzrA
LSPRTDPSHFFSFITSFPLMVSTHRELSRRLAELEKRLESHDEQIQLILKAIRQLMASPEKPTKRIGFQIREKRAFYRKR